MEAADRTGAAAGLFQLADRMRAGEPLPPFDGTVAELSAEAGGQVAEGTVLARIEKEAEKAS